LKKHSFIPFARPDIGEEEIKNVVDTIRSGWMTMGPKTVEFENLFAEKIGPGRIPVSVNSATAGLHLALEALGIGPGDEVIVPTWTFTASAEVIRYLGATPVFCDVDPDSLIMDLELVPSLISPQTKAIMPVHFAGLTCDMNRLFCIAKKFGLYIIEDAAHALPSTFNGKLIGHWPTDATVFSFYATKTITTGEGGMILLKDSSVANRCKIMRLHGINRDVFDRYTSKKPKWHYDIVAPGYKYNSTDIASALGMVQLKRLYEMQKKRQEIADRYLDELKYLPIKLPVNAARGDDHSWHLFVIQLEPEANQSRDGFIEKMSNMGIGCSVHFIPLHLHSYWKKTMFLTEDQFPKATSAFSSCVSLPIYSSLEVEEIDYIIESTQKLLEKR